jgi:hypothetical protein
MDRHFWLRNPVREFTLMNSQTQDACIDIESIPGIGWRRQSQSCHS